MHVLFNQNIYIYINDAALVKFQVTRISVCLIIQKPKTWLTTYITIIFTGNDWKENFMLQVWL